jgi:catechol 2,3-dioxygenase-like lactoylglutathione lyase family enzyme
MRRLLTVVLMSMAGGLAPGQSPNQSRPPITGVSHMTLYAQDLEKSQAFYGSWLGWTQQPAGPARSGVRFYANHAQCIELISPPGQEPDNRLVSVGFSTSDAEAMRRFLAANGVAVPPSVTVDREGNRSFLIHDPEGHAMEFVQQGGRAPRESKSAAPVSLHINHVGIVVHDRAALDRFYKDLLGFRVYWQGGSDPARTEWVMMQVPDGTDWLEYILVQTATPSRGLWGAANHFSPGVVSIAELEKKLQAKGWVAAKGENTLIGKDGKWELNLHDPDGTRVEFAEFLPVEKPCCSAYTGPHPNPSQGW